jgi:hypothetical protein
MNYYETNNINLSAYLLSYGFKLQGTDRGNGKMHFLFENVSNLSEATENFFLDGLVPVNTFANNLRYLKSIIYQKGEY